MGIVTLHQSMPRQIQEEILGCHPLATGAIHYFQLRIPAKGFSKTFSVADRRKAAKGRLPCGLEQAGVYSCLVRKDDT
jgi:hypothetical protein